MGLQERADEIPGRASAVQCCLPLKMVYGSWDPTVKGKEGYEMAAEAAVGLYRSSGYSCYASGGCSRAGVQMVLDWHSHALVVLRWPNADQLKP